MCFVFSFYVIWHKFCICVLFSLVIDCVQCCFVKAIGSYKRYIRFFNFWLLNGPTCITQSIVNYKIVHRLYVYDHLQSIYTIQNTLRVCLVYFSYQPNSNPNKMKNVFIYSFQSEFCGCVCVHDNTFVENERNTKEAYRLRKRPRMRSSLHSTEVEHNKRNLRFVHFLIKKKRKISGKENIFFPYIRHTVTINYL